MFDHQKIDAFFNGDKPFDNEKKEEISVPEYSVWSRFVKLGFPCIAAALIGVMVVMPNIKKSVDLNDINTFPRKSELEKLHIEDTVYYLTDSQNRVSKITADSADEVEGNSKEIKINNPHANIPTNNGEAIISAPTGFFNQESNVLRLTDNVNALIEEKTTVKTQTATYDFKAEYGYGDTAVSVIGDWGNIDASGFEYFKKDQILVLNGHNVITTENGVMTSEEETRYFQAENKTISTGNVVIKHDGNILKADKVISYFKDNGKQDLEKVEAFGHVKVITSKGVAYGDEGTYKPQTSIVELRKNVRIEQDGNFINGSRAETNLKTKISRIISNPEKGERITGIFYNKRKK